jgi:hypothetical protein
MLMADFSDCSMWMTAFSVTQMLWACVTLGFCKGVQVPCLKKDIAITANLANKKRHKIANRWLWISYAIKKINL